ncbi:amino acid ABC transporter permease [bacterium]|jgi:glutamine transport system permease protein|nr:amino acid ABC transporter permease [bacterium]MBT4578191.1 amino acid ABC transporter permease [bacterium]MBT5345858.1 amino acid ABC transporter permease [bacterium]MBT6130837.1 amino acid ABC transporter permease [bacterium]MBT6528847.1 amino acid ABC transporter permease [bacterium]
MIIDFQLIYHALPQLMRGAQITILIGLISCIIGLALGTMFGLALESTTRTLKYPVYLITTVLRGTPMVIQIVFMYAFLPIVGINLPPLWTAIIAVGMNSAAYISSIVRSGIKSISSGQVEAAKVLGFSRLQTLWYIILPRIMRVMLPPLGNELIVLVKDSSLASFIGVTELFKQGSIITSTTYDALSVYAAVGAVYLLITGTLTMGLTALEVRLNRHA